MIVLTRDTAFYTASGDSARLLHEKAGYALFFINGEPTVLFPVESINFHLRAALVVDDVELDGRFYTIANRAFYAREFTALMACAGSKGKWWRGAVDDFEADFRRLVLRSDEKLMEQLTLF